MPKTKNARKYSPFPDDKPCPCGDDLTYKECCKRKKFHFEVDQRGNVIKSLKIHPRLEPFLEKARSEFKEMFGREPGHGDPLVFNHHLTGQDDFWQHAKNIARTAKVREELIFAWRRSGFIVGKHSRDLMPDSDYEKWEDAMDEYSLLKEEGFDPFYVFTYLSGSEYDLYKSLVKFLDRVIIALGFSQTDPKKFIDGASYFRYLFLTRTIRSLRTIREMYNTRYDDDCLAIARSIYEAYLRMKLLRLEPTNGSRFEAILAHEAGLYRTKLKKNGQPNYNICVNPDTGVEYEINISNSETLKISDFPLDTQLYYDLYPLLSSHVHPDLLRDAQRSIVKVDEAQSDEGDSIRAIIFILTICSLVLLETSESSS